MSGVSTITISMNSHLLEIVREYCRQIDIRVGPYLRMHVESCLHTDEQFGAFYDEYEASTQLRERS